MKELEPNQFTRVLPFFKTVRILRSVPLAVIRGRQGGRIFVDRTEDPTVALVSAKGSNWVAGSTTDPDFNRALPRIMLEELNLEPKLLPGSMAWTDLLKNGLARFTAKAPGYDFEFDAALFSHLNWRERIPPGFSIKAIDTELVVRLSELYPTLKKWQPPSSYLTYGFGYCLQEGDKIASVAFSYSAVVPEGFVEIAVRTIPEYQRRGLGTLVCSAFIEHCLKNSFVPDWHTGPSNPGSVALAEKLGFKIVGENATYFIEV